MGVDVCAVCGERGWVLMCVRCGERGEGLMCVEGGRGED